MKQLRKKSSKRLEGREVACKTGVGKVVLTRLLRQKHTTRTKNAKITFELFSFKKSINRNNYKSNT